jgi:hypothetical protein
LRTLQVVRGTQTVAIGSNANAANSLTLEGGNTGGIQIGASNFAHTIGIGSGGSSTIQTVTVGSQYSTSATTIQGGSGGVNLSASPVNINTSGSSTTTIGNSSSATAINGAFTVVAPTNGKDINIGGLFQSACGIVGCNTIINGTGGANITFDNGSSDSDLRITATTHLKSPASNQTAVSIEAAGASSTVPTAIIRQGATPGSAADVLQIQNSSATILGGFNNVGQLYYKNSTFLATISVATLSSAQTITLPNASGTVCLDSGNCSAAGAYIINSASSQTGNINITGTANFGTSVTTAQLTSNGTTLVKTTATAAFQIQDASTNVFFTANTSTGTITFGSGSNTVIFTAAGGLVASGTAQHTKQIALSAEYAGAVLDAASDSSCSSANNGSMTSGYDGTNYKTYYKWISSASAQCYDVVLRVALPSDFNGWSTTTPLTINTYSADTTTGLINVDARDTSNVAETSCAYASATPGSNTTWTNTGSNCTLTGTYAANGTMTLRIRMTGNTSSDVRIGGITLSYSSKF